MELSRSNIDIVTIAALVSIAWVCFQVVTLILQVNGIDFRPYLNFTESVIPINNVISSTGCPPIQCYGMAHIGTRSSTNYCFYQTLDFWKCIRTRAGFGLIN